MSEEELREWWDGVCGSEVPVDVRFSSDYDVQANYYLSKIKALIAAEVEGFAERVKAGHPPIPEHKGGCHFCQLIDRLLAEYAQYKGGK